MNVCGRKRKKEEQQPDKSDKAIKCGHASLSCTRVEVEALLHYKLFIIRPM